MLKAKRKLTNISFESEGSAVALVGPDQGSGANNWKVLLMKATNDISQEDVEKKLSSDEGVTNQTEGNSLSENKNVGDDMSEEMIAKSAVEVEIAKAVELVTKQFEEQLVTKQAELDAALVEVESFKSKEKEAVQKSRHSQLEAAAGSVQAETLMKAFGEVSDEQFAVLVESFKSASKGEQESALFKQMGADVDVETNPSVEEALAKQLEKQFKIKK
jgi:hypothetical protein